MVSRGTRRDECSAGELTELGSKRRRLRGHARRVLVRDAPQRHAGSARDVEGTSARGFRVARAVEEQTSLSDVPKPARQGVGLVSSAKFRALLDDDRADRASGVSTRQRVISFDTRCALVVETLGGRVFGVAPRPARPVRRREAPFVRWVRGCTSTVTSLVMTVLSEGGCSSRVVRCVGRAVGGETGYAIGDLDQPGLAPSSVRNADQVGFLSPSRNREFDSACRVGRGTVGQSSWSRPVVLGEDVCARRARGIGRAPTPRAMLQHQRANSTSVSA